jgi:hypothetical protein
VPIVETCAETSSALLRRLHEARSSRQCCRYFTSSCIGNGVAPIRVLACGTPDTRKVKVVVRAGSYRGSKGPGHKSNHCENGRKFNGRRLRQDAPHMRTLRDGRACRRPRPWTGPSTVTPARRSLITLAQRSGSCVDAPPSAFTPACTLTPLLPARSVRCRGGEWLHARHDSPRPALSTYSWRREIIVRRFTAPGYGLHPPGFPASGDR